MAARFTVAALLMVILSVSLVACGGDTPNNLAGNTPVPASFSRLISAVFTNFPSTIVFVNGPIPAGTGPAPTVTSPDNLTQAGPGSVLTFHVQTAQPVSHIFVGVQGVLGYYDIQVLGAPASRQTTPPNYTVSVTVGMQPPCELILEFSVQTGQQVSQVTQVPVESCGPNINTALPGTLPGGEPVQTLAFDSASGRLYAPSPNGGVINVLDGSSLAVVASIPLGFRATGLALDSAAGFLYASSLGADTLTAVATSTNAVMSALPAGRGPAAAAVLLSSHRILVVDESSGLLSALESGGTGPSKAVSVGRLPVAVDVDQNSNRAYVVNAGSDSLSVVDGSSMSVLSTFPVGHYPAGVAVDGAAGKAFVTDDGVGAVTVVDLAGGLSGTRTVPVGRAPIGIGVNPATHRVYVANSGSGTVTVIDETNLAQLATVRVGILPEAIAIDSLQNRVFILNEGSDTISVMDGRTNTVTTSAELPEGGSPLSTR